MDRPEFQHLAELRLRDAVALMAAGRPEAAYYLGGYAVECALKACIASLTREHEFPDRRRVNDSYTHDLEQLVRVAGLAKSLEARAEADPSFRENWGVVKDWAEASRYASRSLGEASGLLAAIADDDHGVLPWLREYW